MNNVYEIEAYKMDEDKAKVCVGIIKKDIAKGIDDEFNSRKILAIYNEEEEAYFNLLTGEKIEIIDIDKLKLKGILKNSVIIENESPYFVINAKRKKMSKKDVKKYLKSKIKEEKVVNDKYIKLNSNVTVDTLIRDLIDDTESLYPTMKARRALDIDDCLSDIKTLRNEKYNKYTIVKKLLQLNESANICASINIKEKKDYAKKIASLNSIDKILLFIENEKYESLNLKIYSEKLLAKRLSKMLINLDSEDIKKLLESLNPVYKNLVRFYIEKMDQGKKDRKYKLKLLRDEYLEDSSKYIYDTANHVKKKVKSN